MFQQIVVDPVRSRGTGFSLQYRTPEISQSEGLVVDFSIVRSEVYSGPLMLVLSCDTYLVHDSLFFWVNNRRACACVRLKDMSVSTLGPLPLWTSLQHFPAFFIKPRVGLFGDCGCPWDAVCCSIDDVHVRQEINMCLVCVGALNTVYSHCVGVIPGCCVVTLI